MYKGKLVVVPIFLSDFKGFEDCVQTYPMGDRYRVIDDLGCFKDFTLVNPNPRPPNEKEIKNLVLALPNEKLVRLLKAFQ
jgi:hypothetical protein